jgi:hypothetical protein
MARKTCVASRPHPRNAYLAGGFSTGWPWDAAPSEDSPAARGRPVARVAPRVGGAHDTPRLLLVEQPDAAVDHALMLARRLYHPHRTQSFEMEVLRRPGAELGPGVWPRIEITSRNLSLEEAGYHWLDLTEEEKEEASSVLWACFNAMFPPATAEDAAAWAAERWYEPVVREFARGAGVLQLRNGVQFACESTGGSMVTFRFTPGSRRVDVRYSGAVHLSLELAGVVSRSPRALSLELAGRRRAEVMRRYTERRAEERERELEHELEDELEDQLEDLQREYSELTRRQREEEDAEEYAEEYDDDDTLEYT